MKKYRIKYPPKPKRKPFLHTALVPLLILASFAAGMDVGMDMKAKPTAKVASVKKPAKKELTMEQLLDRIEREFSQRDTLSEVWNPENLDITKPIYLFGKDGGKT